MPGDSAHLRERLRKLAATGLVGPARATPSFDEEYLIRCLAYLLKHAGNDRGVALDSRGWASVDEVIHATRRMHWSLGEFTPGRLIDFVRRRANDRFEVYGDRIRARYGHSIPGLAVAEPETPPELLFHGTSQDALPAIRELGLRPMGPLARSHDLGPRLRRESRACGRGRMGRSSRPRGAGSRIRLSAPQGVEPRVACG